ncbi:MAG: YcxB family protein [Saprospiraceae bacterium]|nr:YcxB family protein [Saprospiraceae bacterium]
MEISEKILTRTFHLEPKQYVRLLLRQKWRKSIWWLWPLLLLMAINAFTGYLWVSGLLLLGLLIYAIYIVLEYRHYVQSRKNQALFAPQTFQFTKDYLLQITGQGEASIAYESIQKVEKRPDHLKLHLQDKTWLYIPAEAFRKKEDLLTILDTLDQK